MKLKFILLFTLVVLLVASSGTAFARGSLPSAWSLPRQESSILPIEDAAASVNLTREQVPALTFESIINGDFEQGRGIGWAEWSSHGFPLIEPVANLPLYPHSGNYAAWLGGGDSETSYIIQYGIPIFKPATALHLWYVAASQETVCGNDVGTINIHSDAVFTWDLCAANNSTHWTELTVDLSAYDGLFVSSLSILVVTNGSLNSNLFIDDVSIRVDGVSGIPTFADVPATHPFYPDIEILYANGLTGGCNASPLMFCPNDGMNRAQSAVFMMRGTFGASYIPNPVTNLFIDNWSLGTWGQPWAEAMRETGLTTGCQVSPPLFCAWEQLPREQAVIFGLKLKHGNDYLPPPATGFVFADMTDPNYYATRWAEQGYKEGLLPACGVSNGWPLFCPNMLVSRGMGAYVIVRAKNLTMP